MSQEFRFKNIDETRKNELMSRKHKKVCTTLSYFEHFLILASTITGCISVSAFACMLDIPIGITSSSIGLNIYAIAAGFKKYKSKQLRKKRSMIKQHC